MTNRLNDSTLRSLTDTTLPRYERGSVQVGIVHLGLGAFHRAHQAVYADDLLASGDLRWGIAGVSLRNTQVRSALRPQDCLYTVETLGADTQPYRVIGSIVDSLALPADLEPLLAYLRASTTQVISLTVTEKGYCVDTTGNLDVEHPDIRHDLATPSRPHSAIGLLALGLAERFRTGATPVTVISCDNMLGNGIVTKNAVLTFADRVHPDASSWISERVSFPCSMVDRIVPQTTDEQRQTLTAHGFSDHALVTGETFSQWVIEDTFAGERPPLHLVGVQFTDNIEAWEQAKLRLLNATHSALAYLGLLAGYDYVHEALQNPSLANFARYLLREEITPSVRPPAGLELESYCTSVLNRFGNTAVPYRTRQVAADGSKKLPQRIYPSISARLDRGEPIAGLCLVVAAWLRSLELSATDAEFEAINDPVTLSLFAEAANLDANAAVLCIANRANYFGNLGMRPLFIDTVASALHALRHTPSPDCARRLAL